MIKRTGLTEEQSANSFSDEDLVGMVCGNNPQANAYRELLASRQSLLDCKQRIQQLLAERNSTGLAIDKAPAQYLNFNELECQEIESPLN